MPGPCLTALQGQPSICVILETWHEPQHSRNPVLHYPIGTYGLYYVGKGLNGILWGGGHAKAHAFLLAYGVERALRVFPNDQGIQVWADEELYRYVNPEGGHAFNPKNRGREDWAIFHEVGAALSLGRWEFRQLRGASALRSVAKDAKRLAREDAFKSASAYRSVQEPGFSNSEAADGLKFATPAGPSITVEGP